jgi:uroporphyrinogen decarboxylase
MPDGALYFEQTKFPFAGRTEPPSRAEVAAALRECMWTAVVSPPGPLVSGPDGHERLAAGARQLRQATDRAVVGLFGGNLLEVGQFLYRNDNFFLLLAGEADHAHAFLDALVEIHLGALDRYLAAVGDCIDVIVFGDDLGMQTGPQISPAMYREFFQPRHARMWRRAKELADVKVNLHCCGSVAALLDDLIAAGLDATNPVQVNCRDMEARGLKARFGDRIVFWGGGCDTHRILPHGTPEEVANHVREQIAALAPGGGFVFQQVHNILADVPPANIVAMFDAAAAAAPAS